MRTGMAVAAKTDRRVPCNSAYEYLAIESSTLHTDDDDVHPVCVQLDGTDCTECAFAMKYIQLMRDQLQNVHHQHHHVD